MGNDQSDSSPKPAILHMQSNLQQQSAFMPDASIHPRSSVIAASPVLGYASSREFERAIFRCIGWIGLCISGLLIGRIFADVISTGLLTRPPRWLLVLMNNNRPWLYNFTHDASEYWREVLLPLIEPIIALFLLAGSIGCIRRYTRTRWWMILYAYLHLICAGIGLFIIGYLALMKSFTSSAQYGSWSYIASFPELLHGAADVMRYVAYDIILLWLMTRPHVGEIFAKRE